MNKDYTYCVGFGIDAIPVTLCKNCRRFIPKNEAPKEAIWWTAVQYDPTKEERRKQLNKNEQ